MDRRPRHSHGFTLLELLIVVTVLVSITALVAPRFSNSYANMQLRNAALNLASRMRYAQAHAVAERVPVQVRLNLEDRTYALYVQTDALVGGFERMQGLYGRTFVLPEAVHMKGETDQVTFLPDGRATSTGPSQSEVSWTMGLDGQDEVAVRVRAATGRVIVDEATDV